MNEYMMINRETGERDFIFGYSFNDAARRSGRDWSGWYCDMVTYVD